MKKPFLSLLLLLALFAGGCAANYRTISPQSMPLASLGANDEGLEIAYRFDVLRQYGNKKYAKKEQKRGIRVVAVKISNYTGYDLKFQEDIQLYSGGRPIYPLEPELVHKQLKQSVPSYLFYMLFTFVSLDTYNHSTGKTNSTPIGLFLGPGLTGLNMSIAASANRSFKEELLYYDLYNTTIYDGETVYGLVGIRDDGFAPLDVRLK